MSPGSAEKALVSVIQEAWIAGVSTRRVDELVQAMGMNGISKSSMSKLCYHLQCRYMQLEGMTALTTPHIEEVPTLQITPKAA